MANGDTKTEAMLNVLGNGGSGDEFRGCCNTKTQSYILDAIDRINALQPGGSSDFNDLENRPQLNGVAMTGDTNIANFTGTDGEDDGAQGLVPAPTAADADKFLKSDGTWAEAGGGGGSIKVLTTADYNYPENNPTSVALWLLEPGLYFADSASMTVRVSTSDNASSLSDTFLVTQDPYPNGSVNIYAFGSPGSMNGDIGSALLRCYKVWKNTGGRNTVGAAATHAEIADITGKRIDQWTTKDWPTNSPDGVAIWKLRLQGNRFYFRSNCSVKIYITPNHYLSGNMNGTVDMLYMGGDSNKLLTSFDLQIFDRNTDTMSESRGYGIVDWTDDSELDYKTYVAS